MNKQGRISTLENGAARVTFPSLDNVVSPPLELAAHIQPESLNIGDKVIVVFYNNDLKSGVIIAKVRS